MLFQDFADGNSIYLTKKRSVFIKIFFYTRYKTFDSMETTPGNLKVF